MIIYIEGLDEKQINNYLNNISTFMNSKKALIFDSKYNAKLIADEILKDLE